jgi:hypothetical protein
MRRLDSVGRGVWSFWPLQALFFGWSATVMPSPVLSVIGEASVTR